ncbi:MAG: exo-alpha-sialidase [Bacteroidales bacterium]|nr:exo-alpha-sialidase [Bacteroidales bacterium]
MSLNKLIYVMAAASAICCSKNAALPALQEGLLNLGDTVSLGLERYPGASRIEVYSPGDDRYVNNVLLCRFKGSYYCMWQSSRRDEDTPDTHVMYSISADGRSWQEPHILATATDSCFVSPGGWIQRGDSLSAVLNYVDSEERSRGGVARYIVTHDGVSWSEARSMLMADGTPVDGIFEQDPMLLQGGRTVGAVHFRPGLQLCPVWTDDPSGLRGWTKGALPAGEGKPLEPSQFRRLDGSLVMLMRDQASSFLKLASVSNDGGKSWTPPAITCIPDSRSKQCAGNLPDGTCFMVWNPAESKSRKALAIAFSDDGVVFDRAYLIAGPADLKPRRYDGKYKTLGYSYPKAFVDNDILWISLSENKENALLFRLQLPPSAL